MEEGSETGNSNDTGNTENQNSIIEYYNNSQEVINLVSENNGQITL